MAAAVFRDPFCPEEVVPVVDRSDLDHFALVLSVRACTDDQRAFDAADSGEEEAPTASRHLLPGDRKLLFS
jgi:hypothetical protein